MAKNWENELDRVFSVYIRLKYADFRGYVRCFTCDKVVQWQEAQCGHWIKRGNNATRYDERNCRPQCWECNMTRNGMEESFEEHLRDELDDEEVETLIALGKETKSFSEDEYKTLINRYKLQIRELGGNI